MSQTGYTPIQLYRSSTAAAAPSAGSLADGELAINTTDEKLYFKNASGVVKVLASSAGAFGTVTSVDASGGTTGLTFTGGPITSSGTLTLGGTLAVANGGTGASSLTSGYLVKGNGTSAVTASVVYDNGTNVGIGTSSPSYKLDVAGDVSIDNGGAIVGKNTTGGDAQLLYWSAASGVSVYGRNTLGGSVTQHDFRTAGATRLTIDNSGNVGIGTTSPAARLSVAGRADFGISTDALVYLTNAANAVRGVLDVGTSDFTIGASGGGVPLILLTSGSERMRINSSGNVGIGTTSPDGSGVLTLAGASGTGGLTLQRTNTGVGGAQGFVGFKSVNGFYTAAISNITSGNDDTAGLSFRTAASSTATSPYSLSERMRIDSSGNVGIGTTTPAGLLEVFDVLTVPARNTTTIAGKRGLSVYNNQSGGLIDTTLVYGAAASSYFAIGHHNGTSYSERMRIDSSGNVGIGTSSPSGKLDVSNGGTTALFGADSGADTRTDATPKLARIGVPHYTNAEEPVAMLVPVAGSATNQLQIGGGSGSLNAMNLIQFYTAANNTTVTGSERMRIDSSGNVGIGTSSPSYRLDVSGAGQIGIRYTDTVATNSARMYLTCGTATGALQQYGSSHPTYANALRLDSFAGSLQLATLNTERMRIDNSGNVGIGTTAPGAKLQVDGSGTAIAKIVETSTTGYTGLNFANTGTQNYTLGMGGTSEVAFGVANKFFLYDSLAGAMRMVVDTSGNVGIGTSSPARPLDVAGSARFNSSGNYMEFGTNILTSEDASGAHIRAAVSSAAFPTYSVTGDTNTGAFFPAADTFAFSTAGSERMRIDSSGNVGIGNTPSGTYKLEVTGAIYGSSMVLGAALPVASGGTGATTAATARTNLGATTVGGNLFTLTDPSAITFPRFNADNTVSALDAATFRTAIGAGTGSGTVTSVDASGGTTGLTFTGGPITSSGTLTLGGTLAVANGGTGATTALNARVNLLPSYVGNATKVLAVNSGATDVEWITVGTGTVTSVAASGGTTGLTFSGSPITTSGTITLAGTLAVANGGTGATTAATARTNLGATTVGGNLFTLTNPSAITFPRFNADNTVSALDAATFRTAIGAGTSSTTGTVTSVSGTGTVSGLTLTGTVTTSGSLTLGGTLSVTPSNFASQTANTFLAAPNGVAGVPTFRAIVAADVPTLNQNTTGTAGNVTGTVAIANGGTGATTAATARTNLGATTVGGNLFTLTNPSAITFPRFNADNTVSALDAATFRTAIGAGTSSTTGTVTSVALSGGTTGLTVSGSPITTSGTITLAGTLAVANGGTGATTAATARTNLGATTVGGNLFTLTNPSAITFPRFNADNTVSALDAATFRTAIGAGTGSGTVTSVALSGGTTGLTVSGSPITTSGTITLAGTLAAANGGTGTSTAFTAGSVVFAGTSGVYTQDNANLFWDDTNNRLGIGTSSPTSTLHVSGTVNFTGALTSGDLADAVGYKGLPQNAKTAAYTLALSDMGKHISITTGGITVPANASVAFPIGATIVIFNNSASSQNIAITTDTMYLAGTATTGTRTLAQRGLATVVKVASTTWVISGSGVT